MGAKRFKRRICITSSVEASITSFMKEHVRALNRIYEVSIVTNTQNTDFLQSSNISAQVYNLNIPRDIQLVKDLMAFTKLAKLYRHNRFDVVHSITPKAGLLSVLAGFIARVPVRIHMVTGQVWSTKKGFFRGFLKAMDTLTCMLATNLLADSASQVDFLVSQRVVSQGKITVLGNGSVCGVDLRRFLPSERTRNEVREELGIGLDEIVFLYVGRLKWEKGILDLVQAFTLLAYENNKVRLVLVGPDEDGIRSEVFHAAGAYRSRVQTLDYTPMPERYMAAADVFCLPSYREGFGVVIIEAAAAGIPSIGSRIYGITDAIIDQKTGILFDLGSVDSIFSSMKDLAHNSDKRKAMGESARNRAVASFGMESMVEAMVAYYANIIRP